MKKLVFAVSCCLAVSAHAANIATAPLAASIAVADYLKKQEPQSSTVTAPALRKAKAVHGTPTAFRASTHHLKFVVTDHSTAGKGTKHEALLDVGDLPATIVDEKEMGYLSGVAGNCDGKLSGTTDTVTDGIRIYAQMLEETRDGVVAHVRVDVSTLLSMQNFTVAAPVCEAEGQTEGDQTTGPASDVASQTMTIELPSLKTNGFEESLPLRKGIPKVIEQGDLTIEITLVE
ncbi:hypothetical protein F6X40_09615 [Paraburkholderia sp. UCT31]|uniref:hypothetical protein n=1 Tax=Paraburkholderia sp. UCT31 TaxID=2615209 RepID=UPI0016566E25|nr:hypothetical protein [Paraburkholderia sp. UCT31]MBC8737065.1 hypothetical protein [Paraburkholderia sp. UCT31]